MPARSLLQARVIVTGASAGIGREVALELGRRGGRVVLVARGEAGLRDVAAEFGRTQGEAEVVAGDVTLPATRQAAVARAAERWGGLDIVVNNAGVGALGRFEDSSSDRLRQIMEVNFFAPVELVREALPLLRLGNRPLVVHVGSILGLRGIPQMSDYCASKFALQGWSESLRAELGRLGIDLLVVNPGSTDTDFKSHVIAQTGDEPWGRRRGVPADRVARAAVRAMERGRSEIIPSLSGKLLTLLHRVSPRLVDRLLRKYG